MSPDANRVAELVEAALEREPNEWQTFLSEVCGSDRELRAEVESLLVYQGRAANFIEAPAYQSNAELFADETGELKAGEYVGEYKIVCLLGEGGMGEVYLAEDEELGRKVAIKLVKLGLSRANLIRHFKREERILAGLNDPNIARLYGGAVSENGVPYFVMEYVEGERVDDFCNSKRLAIRERLQLFRKICAAVAYAHQHLVIHRDLKPANIRVTPAGEPKLLDFGIAKVLDDQTTQAFEQTMTMAAVMTPDYASPEQIRGEAMTTASDIYSLGVILYELLTGAKPYRTPHRRLDEISHAITEQEPTRPSAIAPGKGEGRNLKILRGDLDNIVLMAMRKEPSRRYGSVAQFSDDLRRYLEGLPVIAHKDSFSYRSAKFVRRHRFGVIAAALICLATISGMIATTWQWRIARAERAQAQSLFNDVRQLANSFMFEFHDSIQDLPGSTAARALVVKRASEYLDRLALKAYGDLSLQQELVTAYLKVGNVQGNPNNANLGDSAGALKSYRKAKEIAERLLAVGPDDLQARRSLALSDERISEVEASTGDLNGAINMAKGALSVFHAIAQSHPADKEAQLDLAVRYIKVGDLLGNPNFANLGDQTAAMSSYRLALPILKELAVLPSPSLRTQRSLGIIYERLGTMQELAGNLPQAREEYVESQRIRQDLAANNPANTDILRDAAIADEKVGNVLTAERDLPAALESRKKSLGIFRQLAEADPKNVQAQQSLAISYLHLGELLGYPDTPNLGRQNEALESYQKARTILTTIPGASSTDTKVKSTLDLIDQRIAKLR